MKCSIVYSSKTGNTALLAKKIKTILPQEDCVYCGAPDEKAASAEQLFIGFWTDKGSCDEKTAEFLDELHDKQIFLFGTAGFNGSRDYYERILSQTASLLHESNEIIGTFMCQGKMPPSVRQGYETILSTEPEKIKSLIENFDKALSHPNADDLNRLEQVITERLSS